MLIITEDVLDSTPTTSHPVIIFPNVKMSSPGSAFFRVIQYSDVNCIIAYVLSLKHIVNLYAGVKNTVFDSLQVPAVAVGGGVRATDVTGPTRDDCSNGIVSPIVLNYTAVNDTVIKYIVIDLRHQLIMRLKNIVNLH